MSQGHALGLAITGTEITLLLIDATNHDVVARNRVALPAVDATLPDHLDRLVESAPFPAQRVAVACTDPTVQILLTDRARRINAPAWLAHAIITSSTPALTAAVSSKFPGANPLVVVLLDHHGRPETTAPLMLIDPALGTVIDTAQAPSAHLPAYEQAGADALADAMAALPVVGLGVDVIVAAGAGAEMHGVIQEMSRAAGLPVREIGGRYSVAFGAALLAGRERPMPAHGRSPKARPSHLAVAVMGLSAVLLAGGLAVAVAQHPDKEAPSLSDSSLPVTSTSAADDPPSSTGKAAQAPPTRHTSSEAVTSAPSTTESSIATTTESRPPLPATPDSTSRRQNTPNPGRPPATTERETSTRPVYTPPPIYTPPTRTTTPATQTPPDAPAPPPDESENADSSVPDAAPSR
ncbi:hypothetical protein [Williamsia sp. 1135]|uniref:hypothetical protein n=1 Tax=Williamsia sp. 1135 TaxID=1889262 RepID=UPI000A246279|nr:hypothetical protein [Williamsia sp. 1135]ORM32795.1 hypothetical protein BFL43_14880 [Williamsia sp. 1135]